MRGNFYRILMSLGLLSLVSGCGTNTVSTTTLAKYKPNKPTPDGTTPTVVSEQLLGDTHVKTPSDVVTDETTSGQPIAVIPNHVHKFGNMEPHQKRRHHFVIRNDGDAPLKIRAGESSCKCTIGSVGNSVIPPGEESIVTLDWRTTTETKIFAHEAEVLTNDPQNRVLVCRVEGTVLQQLETNPAAFTFSAVEPGKPAEMTVTMTTQVWKSFKLADVRATLKGVEHEVTPLTDEEKQSLAVNDGYKICLRLPSDIERGTFAESVRMEIEPAGESPRLFDLALEGRVLRRVSIYGKGIDSYGRIKLGTIPQGRGLKRYFSVKVRDEDPTIGVKELSTSPEFLQVSFEETNTEIPGLYRMLLEVPASAPPSFFNGEPGNLHVEFENPRLENLDLKVEFAVAET